MIYFDNAATTYPKPESVLHAVTEAIVRYGGNPGHSGHRMAMNAAEQVYLVRKKAADFFNAQPQNVIFTLNCTMALNLALKGLLHRGDHVILSSLEHNAVWRPLERLSRQEIITYDVAPVNEFDAEATVRAFEERIRPQTRLIVCTHASNVSGWVLPIEKIGALCQKHGLWFVVDAAQTAGVLPIDMEAMHIHALCMPGHKGLYGIAGSGMLLLRDTPLLSTVLEGGTGSSSVSPEQPDFLPDRLESGTLGLPGILSVGAGMDFVRSVGMTHIHHFESALCKRVFERLASIPNVHPLLPVYSEEAFAPILSFTIEGMHSEKAANLLDQSGFALRGGLHCAPLAHRHYGTQESGSVRFAPSFFSKRQQVEKFLKNLEIIAEKRSG